MDHYYYNMDALTNQWKALRIRRKKRRKNRNYNQSYFPKATIVRSYVDSSPTRSFWLAHTNQIAVNWYIKLTPGTKKFNNVANPLKEYINCQKLSVYKISNKYLERQYSLKKELKESQGSCGEYVMYHFTTDDNIEGIVHNNFNWRLSGKSRDHKYGCGVSFSPNPQFAEQFCGNEATKLVFVVKVLVSTAHFGEPDMILPDSGFDTTVSPEKTVYVKFEDSEFCPEYLVSYSRICGKKEGENPNYDQSYFPKATIVRTYTNSSPTRSFWLAHPNQIEHNWYINLTPGTKQFNNVANPLKEYINCQIHSLYKISNKYLERQYSLKKELKESQGSCGEYVMYHFTTDDNIKGIVYNNFNWRLSGQSRGHKYGYGISFSPNPQFAEQFCKNKATKVVFVVKVLVSTAHLGEPDMVLPDSGFDTTVSPKKTVYVKFEDSEFYPEYLVCYSRIKKNMF